MGGGQGGKAGSAGRMDSCEGASGEIGKWGFYAIACHIAAVRLLHWVRALGSGAQGKDLTGG